MARKVIRVVDWRGNIYYEGASRREARRVYRANLRPFSFLRIEENGVRVCPRCFSPLESGFIDGGGGWHGASIDDPLPPQCYPASRCWECEPYGSYPNEYVPDDEELAARRQARRRGSLAGQLQRIASSFNASCRGTGEQEKG